MTELPKRLICFRLHSADSDADYAWKLHQQVVGFEDMCCEWFAYIFYEQGLRNCWLLTSSLLEYIST